MDINLFKDIIYSKVSNDKSYVIIKTEHLKIEYNNIHFIMYAVKITADAIKLSKNQRICVIADLFNLKSKNIKLKFIIQFVKLFKEIYPESLEKCVIINTTNFFYNMFGIIKSFIDKVTLDKIEIRKQNKSYFDEIQHLNLEISEQTLS